MFPLIWQAVLSTCLSNIVYCGTVAVVNEREVQHDSILCPAQNFREPLYFPHSTDCQKYYICDEGFPFLRHCQPGLHFNPSLKACDYPENAGCEKAVSEKPRGKIIDDDDLDGCPKKNPMHPIYFPHLTDCSKFYICDSGTPHLKTCEFGLHFNPKLKACDYPENAGCAEAVSEKPRGKIIDEHDLDGCPKKNPMHPIYFSHPTDCSKFYICDNGTPHLKTCEFGLHFNPKLKACDYPENAGCAEAVSEKPRGKIIDEHDLDGCPKKNPMHPIYFPHLTDCSKFYICDSGTPHLKTCEFGLHFNPKIKVCDYPENAGCAEAVSEKPRGRIIDDDDLDGCPKKNPMHPIYFPHPTDCSKFYICDSGTPHLNTCQFGLHFNPKIKACDYPENAECDKGFTVKPKGRMIGNDLDICPAENFQFLVFIRHPSDCRKFYICDSGSPHLQTCQSELHFNHKLKTCDFPEDAGCDEGTSVIPRKKSQDENQLVSCPIKSPGNKPILLPHPTECDKFFMCDNGKSYLKDCQSGLNFNTDLQACDYAENTICYKEDTSMKAEFPTPFCPSVNGKSPIFFRHPSNCSVYYMCSHGLAYEFVCPVRLHFNLRDKVCDYEDRARCIINP